MISTASIDPRASVSSSNWLGHGRGRKSGRSGSFGRVDSLEIQMID
jgi:hypothetical protein